MTKNRKQLKTRSKKRLVGMQASITGATAASFHEGSRSEILADYLFSAWGTVTPVRRQSDYGLDLYCTLTDRVGQRARVREYFSVQVKSGEDAVWSFNDGLFKANHFWQHRVLGLLNQFVVTRLRVLHGTGYHYSGLDAVETALPHIPLVKKYLI